MKRLVRWGVVAAAGLAVLLVLLIRGRGPHPPAAPPAAIQVPVAPVVKRTVPVTLDYVGTTEAIRAVSLQAQVTGYLLKRAAPDGTDVESGALLYRIDPSTYQAALDQAKAQLQRDEAAFHYARANYARNAAMNRAGSVSVDVVQQSLSAQDQAQAAIAADRAAIETAGINLAHTEIRAPFAGRLGIAQVHEGTLITVAGTQLNTLVQLDPIYATFNPPDTDLPAIQEHQAQGPIPVEVLVGNATIPGYQGRLAVLNNSVDRASGTITAQAAIDNPAHRLLPGQFIRVRLHLTDRPGTLLVPQVAVEADQMGKYVFVVGTDHKATPRHVTLGATYGSLVAVAKGLAEGQNVAIGNLLKLRPGMIVKPMPAAAEPEPGGR